MSDYILFSKKGKKERKWFLFVILLVLQILKKKA